MKQTENYAIKVYSRIPNDAIMHFKLKDLYLLAGLYNSAHYSNTSDVCTTNITIKQLSNLTGVSQGYIGEYFLPKFREEDFGECKTHQVEETIKRNEFKLPYPNENYRVIWKHIFSDNSLTPEEKGFLIGLYCLCVNNTFRYDLKDIEIAKKLGMDAKTYRKYRNALIDKKVIWTSYDAPMFFTYAEHLSAKVLMYPHLGYKTWIDLVEEFNPTEDEINDYLLMVEEVA
jgi:hypothetical protein